MFLNRSLYVTAIALLAFSPGLSLVVSDALGLQFSGLNVSKFVWVGVGLSIPATLLAARAIGSRAYCHYWAYLESFPGNTGRRILVAWLGATALAFVSGVATIYADL